ncbi:hypothetical protein TGME49_297647 [Toxoplasma gondii ME49]|uniref:Uncharacterized protein n=1 Tax=Toxoplasma gondii (strain ATCC 50611 / Me49) TaxID=508771 RepID=S8GUA9_TOXGM|nr:hypothetical protein TGME49_297647 [Toxoplasma gondii ME49]EPT32179.1 hypothetical protein TGME49_297647 [Toxoplasma gondii ME49]|eukprot:XP_018638370.1 hypothetical protein TGME49_297647 [Toxoplasma gondii ME49]
MTRVEAYYNHGHIAQVQPSITFRMRRDGRLEKLYTVMLPVAGPSGGGSLHPLSAVVMVCLGAAKVAVAISERDVGHVSAREADAIEFEHLGMVDRSRTVTSSFESAAFQTRRISSFSRFVDASEHVLSVWSVAFCFLELTARLVAFHKARKIDEAPDPSLDYPLPLAFSGSLVTHTGARSPVDVMGFLSLMRHANTLNAYGRSHPETLRRFHRLKPARLSVRVSCDTLCLGWAIQWMRSRESGQCLAKNATFLCSAFLVRFTLNCLLTEALSSREAAAVVGRFPVEKHRTNASE